MFRLLPGSFPTSADEVVQILRRDRTEGPHKSESLSWESTKTLPVLINFHGSGWTVSMHGSDIEYVRRVVEETDYTVLDATYNLAPEHPYPAAIHDAEDVIKWVLARPQEFDVSRGSIPASSAGGTLALISSGELFLKSIFRHLIVIYPPTDFSKDPKDEGAPDTSGKPLPDWMASFFANCYLPAGIDGKQPTVCPAFSRLENVPDNVTITTCACDNLCMEGEAVAQRISDMPGKHCSQLRMEKCNHAWDKSTKRGTEQEEAKRVAYDLAIETLRR